jgi:cellulose synthase operon protein C
MIVPQKTAILRLLAFVLLLLIVQLLAHAALRAEPNTDARAAYSDAKELRAQYDLRGARVHLLNAIKSDPKWVAPHIMQAELAIDLFNGIAAKSEVEKAISLGAKQADVQHLLGAALWLQGDLAQAEAVLTDPDIPANDSVYADRILGRVYMDKGDLSAAEVAFTRALTRAPKDSVMWTEIARFRFATGNQKGAIEAVDYAVSLNNNNVRALEFRGRMVRSQFGLLAALPWFERALQVNPDDVPVLEEYAATLGEAGRTRDMLAQARKIIALDSRNAKALYLQAVIAARAGEYDLARRILAMAGPRMNATPGAMVVMGVSEYELGNYNQAIDIFRHLVLTQQANMDFRRLLARAMYRNGDALDTLDEIKPLAGRPDADNYSLMLAARAFEASGDRDKAAIALDEAAKPVIRHSIPLAEMLTLRAAAQGAAREPNNARFVIPYIRSLMLEKNYDAAAAEAKRLSDSNPGVADAHILMGDVEIERGNVSTAIVAYAKAREINYSEGTMLRLVDAHRRMGNATGAREALIAYLTFNPSSLMAQRLMAYLMLDNKEWGNAIPYLERLRNRIGYNDSILLANLARAYSGMKQHDKAIEAAAIAYRIDPANPMVTHVYGQVLLKSGKRPKAALELLQKADILVPGNKEILAELKQAKAVRGRPRA